MKTLRKKIENCLWYDEDNDQTEFVVDNIEKLIIKEKLKAYKEGYETATLDFAERIHRNELPKVKIKPINSKEINKLAKKVKKSFEEEERYKKKD